MNWTRISLHALFWLVYLPINAALSCVIRGRTLEEEFHVALIGEAYSLPVKMLFVYFIFYYVIPLYLERSKIWQLIGLLVIAFFAAAILYRMEIAWVYFPLNHPELKISIFSFKGIMLTVFDLFITLAAAMTVKLLRMHYKSLEFEQELIREKLSSELNFLRAQTNPHFLFNTLNNLYVLARKKSDKTADAIMMLSKIMRYVIYECRAPRVAVGDEAKIIQDYIELEKLRYNKRLSIDYQEEMDNPHTSIAPLLLLPFVENSFKHGANGTTGNVEIQIHLTLHENELSFSVKNTVDSDFELPPADKNGGGIGLKNVQRQLDLLYPNLYELHTGRENGYFKSDLKIRLTEE
jgi:LytS/YehU family sensor histidine kinase